MPDNSLPLAHLKVLDLTRVRGGPACVRMLADWGADAIRVETPPAQSGEDGYTGDRHSSDFQNLHRNKRSLTLNLKHAEAKEIFARLVAQSDIVVENYRPDVKFRLGIDYESLKAINPRIILGSLSGFGQDGPYANRPGVDQIAQGMGGMMAVTGFPDGGPIRAGTAIGDLTGGLFLAFGILTAVIERERSGEGQWVQTSLLESMIAMMDFQATRWLMDGEVPGQTGNSHPTGAATNMFPTSDGHINIAGGQAQIWPRLCEALEAPHLMQDPELSNPVKRRNNREYVVAEISAATRKRTSADWVERLNAAGVPCGPIYKMDEVFADPQVQHLGMAGPVHHPILGDINLVAQPLHLSRAPRTIRSATPEAGEHTDALLTELGYDAATIARLHEEKAI
ncbi:MAG: crotonobetainyl-CoA:carnitine CoA-transferase CaiB-like acyl-CoA transferase [Alphaproteobacteria bacterium]|jgi:crotonobetainyl-CoA:carnitine CoA-transferase CaiB-like acyl-CoA transferase